MLDRLPISQRLAEFRAPTKELERTRDFAVVDEDGNVIKEGKPPAEFRETKDRPTNAPQLEAPNVRDGGEVIMKINLPVKQD